MEKQLLLLGMLRMHDMHGYQLNEMLEAHRSLFVPVKKATAYHLLGKMTQKGWISFKEEQVGNRPVRRVYAITPEGEDAFQAMVRQSLDAYTPAAFQSNISLLFLDALPAEESIPLLQKRREIVEGLLEEVLAHPEHPGSFGLLLLHRQRHFRAELEWVDEILLKLEQGHLGAA